MAETSTMPPALVTAGRAILAGQLRHVLTAMGVVAIEHGVATQGQVNAAVPAAVDYISGLLLVAVPMASSALSKIAPGHSLSTILAAISSLSNPPGAASVPADPATASPVTTKETFMSIISKLRSVLGIMAVAVAPTWNKDIANGLAQAEATLVPLLGDEAKKLCEDLQSSTDNGFVKLGNAVTDLAKIAIDKGINADLMVLTVIVAKAYAQVKADAPTLLDEAIESGVTVAASSAITAIAA